MTTTTTGFRAAYWVSDDRQADVLLTDETQASLPDEDLLAAARAEAAKVALDLSSGKILIGEWRR